jgi:hypothetical protein
MVIDGRAPRDVVAERIWSVVRERLHPEPVVITESTGP